jgi:eukaryotic-like serine/threonine-protein kinase
MKICPECQASYPDGTALCTADQSLLVPGDDLPPADLPLQPGTMVGEYRVDHKLGSGTFGDVYAGEQPLIGKKIAVKVLRQRFSADPQVVSRFISEARAVNRIRHRNIIDIFSFGRLPDRRNYFVMELLEGLTLGDLLRRERRLAVPDALAILRSIADALDAAHEAGVTHRDLKPDNIFLAVEKDHYFPKLLDFGVAKLVADDMAHKTATGVAIGTPRYMSPEQARGKPVDHRADIYALGVVVHEMLTGQPPFEADTAMDVLLKHMVDPPPKLSDVCSDLPAALDAPVLAMLAKRREERPLSAGAAVAALAESARRSMEAATLTLRPLDLAELTTREATREATRERAVAAADVATVAMAGRGAAPGAGTRTDEKSATTTAPVSPPLTTLRSPGDTVEEAPPDGLAETVAALSAPASVRPPAKLPATLLAARAPAPAATVDGGALVQPDAARAAPASRTWVWALVAAAAVAVGMATFGRGASPAGPASGVTPSATPREPPAEATLPAGTTAHAPPPVILAPADAGAAAPPASAAMRPTAHAAEKKPPKGPLSPDLDQPPEFHRP